MKRGIIHWRSIKGIYSNFYFLFFILYSLSLISASPVIKFQHEEIQPGETIIATISTSGLFIEPIQSSQIKFFEGRKEVVLETEISLYNNTHYLSIYTNQEANLTLKVENILYKESGVIKSFTISKNITIEKNILFDNQINQTYTKILKIRPGFIFSSTPKLKLVNLGTSLINITYEGNIISLDPQTAQEVEFIPEEPFSFSKVLSYKDFLIPVVYIKIKENESIQILNMTGVPISTAKDSLGQNSNLTLIETVVGNSYLKTIELFNLGNNNITDIKISLPLDFLGINTPLSIEARKAQNITLELNPKTPGNFDGIINISYTQNETKSILIIPINILVLPSGTVKENFTQIDKKCKGLGSVCESGTICNGTATFTDNYTKYCCIASCVSTSDEKSNSSDFGWIAGIIIFVILGYMAYYFYKKQKLIQTPTPKDSIRATTEKLEKRLAGNPTKRTTGNISKY